MPKSRHNRKRKNDPSDSFFATEPAVLPTYGTGEASEVLGIPIWRIQKFMDSRQYCLTPMGKLGEGRGSRRVFSLEDLHRIALANRLVKDGFATQFIGYVLQQFEDNEVSSGYIDHEGEDSSLGVAFYRGEERPEVRIYDVRYAPQLGQKNSPFYRLDLDDVFTEVDRRIAKLQKTPQP